MDNQPSSFREQVIASLEQNCLDGDKVQAGQMVASTQIAEWIEDCLPDLIARTVIGPDLDDGDGWDWAFGDEAKCCPGDDFSYFGNHIKAQMRRIIAAEEKEDV